jgi:hypothetical protein
MAQHITRNGLATLLLTALDQPLTFAAMRHPLLALCLVCTLSVLGQGKDKARPLIQFSGVVVTGDSLLPVPFASIGTKGSFRGTVSDVFGYFSFVAQVGDTLQFAAVGFKRDWYAIPDSMTASKYSIIHVMHPDTILLDPLMVYPWPTKEQFADAFMNLRLNDDDYQTALKRLSTAEVLQRMENMPPDAGLSQQYAMAVENTRLYNQGSAPTIGLLNPIAWAQFMQAWRSGKFKKK